MRGIALRYCLAGVHPRLRLSGSRIKCGMTAQARRLCCFAAVAAIATACASLLVSLMRQLGCGSAAGMTAERKTRGKGLPCTQKTAGNHVASGGINKPWLALLYGLQVGEFFPSFCRLVGCQYLGWYIYGNVAFHLFKSIASYHGRHGR